MANLEQLIGAYFHQDWNHVYPGREAAVADFVRREPLKVAEAYREARVLLDSSNDLELVDRLDAMGFDDAPEEGARQFLTLVGDQLEQALGAVGASAQSGRGTELGHSSHEPTSSNFKGLAYLLPAYFHQDRDHTQDTWEGVIDEFVRKDSISAKSVPSEIDALLSRCTDEELDGVLRDLGCHYAPPEGDRAWLKAVREHLVSQLGR